MIIKVKSRLCMNQPRSQLNGDEIVPVVSTVIKRGNSTQGSVDGICSSAGSPGKRTLICT